MRRATGGTAIRRRRRPSRAIARGELLNREQKKKFLIVGRGQKITIQLSTVDAPGGAKINLNPNLWRNNQLYSKVLVYTARLKEL